MAGVKPSSNSTEAPAMLMPSLAHSRSVKETIQEVKMVQVCIFAVGHMQGFHCLKIPLVLGDGLTVFIQRFIFTLFK